MSNSILIPPSSRNELASNGHATCWDNIRSLNGIPADRISARTVSPAQFNIGNSFQIKGSSFFAELKRRKVYKVAVAYAVVSWLLIQVASIFLPTFDAPPCIMKALVVFLALGFVLSAVLSWIFDITPQGIKRTGDISPDEAVDIVRQLEAQARQEFVRGYLSALLYAGVGDKMKAIDYLKHEYLNRDNINPTDVSIDAMFEGMRCDPRFEALLQRPQ
jgi:hypothetical protein